MVQLDSETNRKRLSESFNIDLPIETLFTHVHEIQLQAPATDPISDGAAIANTISVLEATGVLDNAISMWNSMSEAEKTMDKFHMFFFAQDKERCRKLTAKTAGFHGANAATSAPTHNITPPPRLLSLMHELELLICITATHMASHAMPSTIPPLAPSKAQIIKMKQRSQWAAAIHLCSPRRTAPEDPIMNWDEGSHVPLMTNPNRILTKTLIPYSVPIR